MNVVSIEPEAASVASNFVASVLTSVMDRRSEAKGGQSSPPPAPATEQQVIGAELIDDREDLDECDLGPQDTMLSPSVSPTSSTPICMQHRGESRQILDTPSTEMGLSPSPRGWRSQPSTSHSFGRGGAMTPAPRAGSSLAMRASTSMDYVRESQHEEMTEAFSQPPTEGYIPSPPRTAPGARRPLLQRGGSFPLAATSSQMPVCPAPLEWTQSVREKENKEEYNQLSARLSARQFLSEIILGKVLSIGASSNTAHQPIDQRSETVPQQFLAIEKDTKATSFCSSLCLEDMQGERHCCASSVASESDDITKIEGTTSATSASRPLALQGNTANPPHKATDSPQPELPTSQPTPRPRSRQGPQAQAPRRPVTSAIESPRQRYRKQSLQEAKIPTEVKKRRASDMIGTSSVHSEVSSDTFVQPITTNMTKSRTLPATPSPAPGRPASAKSKGKAGQDTCTCGNVFHGDALFCPKCGNRRPQTPQELREVCHCGNVFKVDSNFCRKCGSARPIVKAAPNRLQRRSTVSPMLSGRKPRPPTQKIRGELDTGVQGSSPGAIASLDDDDDLLGNFGFDICGLSHRLLGAETPDIHRCESVLSHATESGGHGSDIEIAESRYHVEMCEHGNPLGVQSTEICSEMQVQGDWQNYEEFQDHSQQVQAVYNHRVAFEQDQYGFVDSHNASQYPDHGHGDLTLMCDHDPRVMAVGSCVPIGWASYNPYDSLIAAESNNAVAELGEYNTSADLEASVSGQQLGHLLASSCGINLFSSSPVTLSLDEHTVAAVYAAAGFSLEHFDNVGMHEDQYDSEITHPELATEEEALLATTDLPIAEEELAAERRARETGRRGRESTNAEQDLVVVKAKGANASTATTGIGSHSIESEEGSLTHTDSRRNTRSTLECTATGLQVESVRLLEDLHNFRSRGASINPQSKQPNSVGRVLDTSARKSPFGRTRRGEKQSHTNSLQNRPNWSTSFNNVHNRRIPRYDALIDDHCPVMTSPVRLKQVLQTREVSSEYLHIVRSRFESHRRAFDPECKLGDRSRPESTAAQKMKASNARTPATFAKRVTQLQNGLPSTADDWEEKGDQFASLLDQSPLQGPEEEQLRIAPSLASSTEWHDMPLYYQCLKERKGDVTDGLPSLCAPDDDSGSANEELPARWERLRIRIEMLWREVLIPPDIRIEISSGPFLAMTADSVYRLEMHQKELLDFRLATKRIIHDCLQHDEILDAVKHAHALGVNDSRLTTLRDDLMVLDKLGTSLVRAIGVWSRRFGHLAVDISKLPPFRSDGPKPRAVFLWKGHDMVEHIQTVSDALSSGNLHQLADCTSDQDMQMGDASNNAKRLSNVQRGSVTAREKDNHANASMSPLVSLAMVSQKFSVNDVLHEGPPPTWYHPRIAKAGIAAIRRGLPCGGGDKRL